MTKMHELQLERFTNIYPKNPRPNEPLSLKNLGVVLDKLGNPHCSLPPIIHIAGTNGKGSTLSFLKAMGEAKGLRIHTTSSPHLQSLNERICLQGKSISDDLLCSFWEEVEYARDTIVLSFFEMITAMGFLAFSRVKGDLLVLEVGLGGQYDATNIIPSSKCALITSISQDHQNYLGRDLKKIAKEKSGIMRQDARCFSAKQDEGVCSVLRQTANKLGASLSIQNESFGWSLGEDNEFIIWDEQTKIKTRNPRLLGAHQKDNALLAIQAAQYLGWEQKAIEEGLQNAEPKARLQILKQEGFYHLTSRPPQHIILDGAHNVAGAKALTEFFRTNKMFYQPSHMPFHMICAVGKEKDIHNILEAFLPLKPTIFATTPKQKAGFFTPTHITHIAKEKGLKAKAFKDFQTAFSMVPETACLVICGSFYLAGEVLDLYQDHKT